METAISRTGRAEIATDPMGVEISDTYIMLKPRREWRFKNKEELVQAISEAMEHHVPGAMIRLGCASARAGASALHTPTFDVDASCSTCDDVLCTSM